MNNRSVSYLERIERVYVCVCNNSETFRKDKFLSWSGIWREVATIMGEGILVIELNQFKEKFVEIRFLHMTGDDVHVHGSVSEIFEERIYTV